MSGAARRTLQEVLGTLRLMHKSISQAPRAHERECKMHKHTYRSVRDADLHMTAHPVTIKNYIKVTFKMVKAPRTPAPMRTYER